MAKRKYHKPVILAASVTGTKPDNPLCDPGKYHGGPDESIPTLIEGFETAVGEELTSYVTRLIDKLMERDEDLEDDNTWDLIKKLTGLLVEAWAIDELQESLEKIVEKDGEKLKVIGEGH